jgi:arsenical pump membrane protein
LPSAEEATKHKGYFRYPRWVLAAVAVAYVVASAIQLPPSLIALSGAVLLLIGALSWRRISLPETASHFSVLTKTAEGMQSEEHLGESKRIA